jgi:hypothetical protein
MITELLLLKCPRAIDGSHEKLKYTENMNSCYSYIWVKTCKDANACVLLNLFQKKVERTKCHLIIQLTTHF